MRKLTYILLVFLSLGFMSSCLLEDTSSFDANDDGYNLAGFESVRTTVTAVADGNEYNFKLKVKIIGPTSMDLTEDVVLTIGVDPSSTAVENTHFRIDNNQVTLTKSNNYLGFFEFTMITDGILPPLEEAPLLVLTAESATGAANVTGNGKKMAVTLNYACFSDLAGDYSAVMLYTSYTGTVSTINFTDTWTMTGVGTYRTEEVGHWIGGLGVGTPGFTFYDICRDITIPGQYLVDYYGNWVQGTDLGSVDPETGVVHMVYSICYPQGSTNCRYYDVTYTPVVSK